MRRTPGQRRGIRHTDGGAIMGEASGNRARATARERQRRTSARKRRLSVVSLGMAGMVLAAMLLSACGSDASQAQAQANKTKLDNELTRARVDLGLPSSLLAPVTNGEKQASVGNGGWTYDYANAAQRYAQLYTQLVGIEQSSTTLLQQQTQHDIDALSALLQQQQAQGFGAADAYQTTLDTAAQQFTTAKTTADFARIDANVSAQLSTLHALWPAFQNLQDLKSLLGMIKKAGGDVSLGEQLVASDEQALGNPATANVSTLSSVIDAQVAQVLADQTSALPDVANTMLTTLQSRVSALQQVGDATDAATLQQEHDADAQQLAQATQLGDYLKVTQTIDVQTQAMALPLARAQANQDLSTLMALIAQGQAIKVGGVAADYEYANQTVGYGDAANEVHNAATLDDYLTADSDVTMLITNLRALLANLNDPTPHNQVHQTDLQLMEHYGAMDGKTIVISLREQTARFYDNGQLVYVAPMASGRPEAPSPPGLHFAMYKQTHIVFHSPDPKTSPLWYAPTKINFGIEYANYGYFLHDAWWRIKFGPGANLPHFDPAAFNGGSHGCVNFPLSIMQWIYNWTPIGTPIIVY